MAPANEVNNLQAIPFLKLSVRPSFSGYDRAVQLYRDPVGFHSEAFNQRGKGKVPFKAAGLAIDFNGQGEFSNTVIL